jgi:hypothetical protein
MTGPVTLTDMTLSGSSIVNGDGQLVTGSGTFTGGATSKFICVRTAGLINASGNLTGFATYTYTNGFTIENQETNTWDGTTFPSSANVNYIMSGSSKTMSFSTNYSMKSLTSTAGTINSSSAGTQRTLTITNTSTCTGTTFKDLKCVLATPANGNWVINAKTGSCVNQGNNLGITFVDTLIS